MKVIPLQGITSFKTQTLGSVNTDIFLTPQVTTNHVFHLVPSDFPITCDAILGTDFLTKSNAIIDFGENGILLYKYVWINFKIMNFCENTNPNYVSHISSIGIIPNEDSEWWLHPDLKTFLEYNSTSMNNQESDTRLKRHLL